MTDFEVFIKKNGIKKKDVALYLDVSNAFITQLANGKRQLPLDKFALIKANPNWDTSMLKNMATVVNDSGVVVNGNNLHSPIDNRHYYSDSPDVLRTQIDQLEALIREKEVRLAEKDKQIAEKDKQIAEKDKQIAGLIASLKKQ